MLLNCTSLALILNAGFTAAAAARREDRADLAVAREMVLFVKNAATEFQIVELKEWLSPKYMSLRERDPSCSMTKI